MLDHCDNSGAVDYNPKIASFKIGQAVKPEHLAELQSRLKTLQSGKLWITKFVRFQFGSLEPTNNPHRSILKLLSFHGLKYPEDTEISSPCQGAEEGLPSPPRLDKDQDRIKTGQEEGVQGEKPTRIKDSTVLPPLLDASEPFREAWKRWLSHLKQKRHPATLHAQDLQLKDLAELGVDKAIATLNHCIKKNWRGIYEPTDQSNSRSGSQPPPVVKGSSAVNGF